MATVNPPSLSPHLIVREYGGRPFWEAKFRDGTRQVKRRLGPAWLARAGSAQARPNGATYKGGEWLQRSGRPADGALNYQQAVALMSEVVETYQRDQARATATLIAAHIYAERPRTFRELAHAWREYLDRKGTKPSTLVGYDAMLREPGMAYRRGVGSTRGYIMAELGDTPAKDISAADVERLLSAISATSATPRTVEKHRIMVRSILNFGIRETNRARAGTGGAGGHDYGLTVNAAQVAEGPRQRARGVLVYYLPEEVEALARALEGGYHRQARPQHQPTCRVNTGGECACTPEFRVGRLKFTDPADAAQHLREHRDDGQVRSDAQDAAAVRVSAYTGLRLGELLALRWSDVDWAGAALTVSKAISAGIETSPKSGKVRRVPLPDQAITALEQLSRRRDFTQHDELVFCNVVSGRPIDGSALRRRFKVAQNAAGVHKLRWHDLRHTYGSLLAASGEELVTIKSAMGHANISTTELYLHARPATELAARFTVAFAPRTIGTQPAATA